MIAPDGGHILSESDAIACVTEVLNQIGRPTRDVRADTRLDRLDLESLDMIEVFMKLEAIAGAELDSASLSDVEIVGDLVRLQAASL